MNSMVPEVKYMSDSRSKFTRATSRDKAVEPGDCRSQGQRQEDFKKSRAAFKEDTKVLQKAIVSEAYKILKVPGRGAAQGLPLKSRQHGVMMMIHSGLLPEDAVHAVGYPRREAKVVFQGWMNSSPEFAQALFRATKDILLMGAHGVAKLIAEFVVEEGVWQNHPAVALRMGTLMLESSGFLTRGSRTTMVDQRGSLVQIVQDVSTSELRRKVMELIGVSGPDAGRPNLVDLGRVAEAQGDGSKGD